MEYLSLLTHFAVFYYFYFSKTLQIYQPVIYFFNDSKERHTYGHRVGQECLNPLSANPKKWSNIQTIRRQQPRNCLSVFDHLWGWH